MLFFYRVISSAVERLVYTERVGGSIPSSPTILLIILCFLLVGCGRKGPLEPPQEDDYPRQYPAYQESVVK
jgi:predicted small lipoprotein YifL